MFYNSINFIKCTSDGYSNQNSQKIPVPSGFGFTKLGSGFHPYRVLKNYEFSGNSAKFYYKNNKNYTID